MHLKYILIVLYKYSHGTISTVNHEYCTRYKENINIKILNSINILVQKVVFLYQ